MYILLLAILVLSSLALIILVLMQSGKGSGLSGAFGSAGGGESSLFGANTATVVMKATAVFATIFMLSCIAVAIYQRSMYKPLSFGTIKSEEQIEAGTTAKDEAPKDQEKEKGTDSVAPEEGDTGMTTDETKETESADDVKEEKAETPKDVSEEPVKEEPAEEDGKE